MIYSRFFFFFFYTIIVTTQILIIMENRDYRSFYHLFVVKSEWIVRTKTLVDEKREREKDIFLLLK